MYIINYVSVFFRDQCLTNQPKTDLKFEISNEVPSVSPKKGGKIQINNTPINTQNKWAYIVGKSSLAVSPHYVFE